MDGHVIESSQRHARHASDARRLRAFPKDESYGENLKAMDASDPAAGDLGTLASGSSDDALVIDPAAVSAAFVDQLDDSVMRDALFTLGFDEIPPMSFTTSVGGDDADGDGEDGGKKARTTGSNQRAVQKRYRERKKQHTASLEAKVAELQSRIDELESEKREMSDLGANGATDRRAAQGGDESGIASTACGLVDAASIGGDGRMSSTCEKARKEYLLKFGERVRHMRSALERGASDGELRQTLRAMLAHCLGKNPEFAPSGPALNSMITSNARMLNREAAAAANVRGGTVSTHSGGSEGSDGFMAHPELKTALMRSNEGIVRANGAVCQSVCGGPLRVTIDGSNPSEEEASAHWITVAGALRDSVPPSEVTKLIRWRDEYVAAISNIYEERQRIGAKLAGVGQSYARTGSRGDDSPPSDESTPGDGTSPIVAETTQGEAFVDTIAVVEALRESVTRELELKMRSIPALVLETLSPRTSAAIIVSSYPFLPDAVAIASLMKTWRDDGNSVKV